MKVENETTLTRWLDGRNLPEGRSIQAFKQAVTQQLIKDFQWDTERVAEVRISLLQLLEDEINWGMDRNPTALFASFYRLDLGEGVIREVMDWNERPKLPLSWRPCALSVRLRRCGCVGRSAPLTPRGLRRGFLSISSPSSGLSVSLLHEPTYSPHGPFRFHQPS